MIDNVTKALELIEDMKSQLPIPVKPRPELLEMLEVAPEALPQSENWEIESLYYLGDEAGISCGICLSEKRARPLVVSLTHLRVDYNHPLAPRIQDYQARRTRNIARLQRRERPTKAKPKRKPRKRKKAR